jgi:predicted type IV restriction endonuclease
MPRTALDRETKKAILDARSMIQAAEKADCNEAETRRRIERIFESLMGYDAFKHLSRERAVRGAGETEHVDFALQLKEGEDAKPEIMIEIKRVCIDLAPKHLKQVSSYAINAGCEWILLTNSKEWRLYHVSFGQPPITKLIHGWNIVTDDVSVLAKRFDMISYKNVKRGGLDELWQKTNVLHPRNLLQAILSESSLNAVRRELRKDSGVLLSPEEIVSGVRRLLNETALTELENARISIPESKRQPKRTKKKDMRNAGSATDETENVSEAEASSEDSVESTSPPYSESAPSASSETVT